MITKVSTLFIAILLLCGAAPSDLKAVDGFWLPLLLKSLNEAEMQEMGMKLSAEDIYSINQGSLKDAIVHFGGFCTSELISDQGLLLTNHHCGYGQIQQHSTTENNILKNGFWAESQSGELPNPGLTATFIDRIIDVSVPVLQGVTDQMTESERQSQVDKNIDALKKSMTLKEYEDLVVRPFYYGNQYFAFVTITYKDVRLVGTPPESIGKFGADTDNWEWPRHTGDFAIFRIYAGADNLPAEYSENNVPYKPKHHLPISLDGVEEGDFTMVFGFPGRTQEYLPSYAVEQILEVVNPTRIGLRDKALKIMDGYMRSSEKSKIQYASKFARIANGWKKWIGESQGLTKNDVVATKAAEEKKFKEEILINPGWNRQYRDVLPAFEANYDSVADYRLAHEYYMETFYRNTEIFRVSSRMRGLLTTLEENGEEAWMEEKDKRRDGLMGFYSDYDARIDHEVALALISDLVENLPVDHLSPSLQEFKGNKEKMEASLLGAFGESLLTNPKSMTSLLEAHPDSFRVYLERDPIVQMEQEVIGFYRSEISPTKTRLEDRISILQRKYMRALMERGVNQRMYPDANGTMRVSYGRMEGYSPRDAVSYHPQTYLEGVIEKYVPGDYEFDVPARLLELYETKDYGQYGEKTSEGETKLPVCFLGSNHTTGGNSGSPVIDGEGRLIGINFDRTWEGTMSDVYYDIEICRNIMVDIRYVLFVVDKFAGADWIVDEMSLVSEKSVPRQSIDSTEEKMPMKKPTLMESLPERKPAVEKE